MNWDAIGAVGEVAGAVAVVITLVYLAIQIKYSKQATVDSITLGRTKIICEGMMSLAANDKLRESFDLVSGMSELNETMAVEFDVTPDDIGRTHYSVAHWFWLHWGQFTAAKTEKDVEELGILIRNFYSNAAIRYIWETSPIVKPLLDKAFVDFVEKIIKELDSSKIEMPTGDA